MAVAGADPPHSEWSDFSEEDKQAKLGEYIRDYPQVFHEDLRDWPTFISWFMAFEHVPLERLEALNEKLEEERQTYTIFPSREKLWTFTRFFDIDQTKVVILLQDPYPTQDWDRPWIQNGKTKTGWRTRFLPKFLRL